MLLNPSRHALWAVTSLAEPRPQRFAVPPMTDPPHAMALLEPQHTLSGCLEVPALESSREEAMLPHHQCCGGALIQCWRANPYLLNLPWQILGSSRRSRQTHLASKAKPRRCYMVRAARQGTMGKSACDPSLALALAWP